MSDGVLSVFLMQINENINPNWVNKVCKRSVTIAICSFAYIGKSKELNNVGIISTWGDMWFKSASIISGQSVLSVQFKATIEMGTFHIRGAIEFLILDQFWQMRCQNYCD